MDKVQSLEYDVVIVGAGFAGVCQARHLMLSIPNIKVALVDPRPEERTEKDLKLGESTVEIGTLFVCKELGLYEYMIENHPPKFGLNFHWPKDLAKTETLDDYYHVWTNRQPPLASVQMNRAKFERDLLKMNKKMGVVFYNGRVVDVDLTPKDATKTVKVKVDSDYINLKAKHVIDAAGRKFVIGRKKDNLLFRQEDLFGINAGAAWVRVKNVDRTIFHDGYDPSGATCSHYYATNHWFSHGNWLWMIPTDKETKEVSIGIVQHHEAISATDINTLDKFYSFLKANHKILYQLVISGENIDFHYLPRLAHTSKTMFSSDNWYVIGDAACIFDAFYSLGTTMIAFAVECVTEIIRAKLAGDADAQKKQEAYNEFMLAYTQRINQLYQYHPKHLGHASIMSWRIYLEYMGWFGVIVPMYVGKWHLNLNFIPRFIKSTYASTNGFYKEVYEQFTELAERGANIGLMDCNRADQLLGDYSPLKHFDDYLENTKLEPRRCNIFASIKYTNFYLAIWYLKFQWKGFGISGVLHSRHIYNFFNLLKGAGQAMVGEMIFRYKTRLLPNNSQITKMRQEFKTYCYQPSLQPWINDVTETPLLDREISQVKSSVAVES